MVTVGGKKETQMEDRKPGYKSSENYTLGGGLAFVIQQISAGQDVPVEILWLIGFCFAMTKVEKMVSYFSKNVTITRTEGK